MMMTALLVSQRAENGRVTSVLDADDDHSNGNWSAQSLF
jgi:hypothetical protein